jgi:hypothetical protein
MTGGWLQFEPWSQRSVNFLYGGTRKPHFPLPLVLSAWLLVALVLVWLWPGADRASRPAALAVLCLVAWMVFDVRWTANSYRQSLETFDRFAGRSPHERLLNGMDGPVYQYIEQIKGRYLGRDSVRLVIVGRLEGSSNYLIKRARYHLLPHSSGITSKLTKNYLESEFDYVLFIDDFSGLSRQQIAARLPIDEAWHSRLRPVSGNELGILFSVAPGE